MKLLLNLVLLVSLFSCASSYKTLYTMDDESKPSWVTSEKSFEEDDNELYFIGLFETEYNPSMNMNAVRKASELLACAELSKTVRTAVTSNGRLDTIGINTPDKINAFVNQKSKALVNKAHVENRWYKVIEREVNDTKLQYIQYFSRVKIDKKSFMKSINIESK